MIILPNGFKVEIDKSYYKVDVQRSKDSVNDYIIEFGSEFVSDAAYISHYQSLRWEIWGAIRLLFKND